MNEHEEEIWTPTFYRDLIATQTRIETKLDQVMDSVRGLPARVQALEQEAKSAKGVFRVMLVIFVAGMPGIATASWNLIKVVIQHQ
jgi:hypothetical protein